jgi:hypothetical protein
MYGLIDLAVKAKRITPLIADNALFNLGDLSE